MKHIDAMPALWYAVAGDKWSKSNVSKVLIPRGIRGANQALAMGMGRGIISLKTVMAYAILSLLMSA